MMDSDASPCHLKCGTNAPMNLDKKPNQNLTHLNQKILLPNTLKLEEGLQSDIKPVEVKLVQVHAV